MSKDFFPYRFTASDKYFRPPEGILVGVDGQLSEEVGDALGARALPVGPRVHGEHLVALQKLVVRHSESEAASPKSDCIKKAGKIFFVLCLLLL